MRSLRYLKTKLAVEHWIDGQLSKHKTINRLREDYEKGRKIKAELFLGLGNACAPPRDTVDLARGTAYVLRNEVGQPIEKIVLNGDKPDDEPKVLWERDHDDTPAEIILSRCYRTKYGNPGRYVIA